MRVEMEELPAERAMVFIAGSIREAERVEEVLESAGIEHAVELTKYVGGLLFPSELNGVGFHVAAEAAAQARELLRAARFKRGRIVE